MAVLRLQDIHVSFGPQQVLAGVDLQVNAGARVGLVGRNGAGKTTLLKVIAGEQSPEHGAVHMQKGTTVRFYRQERAFGDGDAENAPTVLEAAEQARPELLELEARMEALGAAAEAGKAGAADTLAHAQEQYGVLGGWRHRAEVRQVLSGLGLGQRFWDQKATSLSGGEASRVALAHLLLSRPQLLLLDEPTNHLDVDAVEFLEGFLRQFEGAVLLVSHDRAFLDACVTQVAELRSGQLDLYTGGYSDFQVERQLRDQRALKAFEHQQDFIVRTQAWIAKNMASASSARQAQSRRKMLARLERLDAPPPDGSAANITFPSGMRSADVVINAAGLTMGFADRTLFSNVDLSIRRGEKIGVAGPNGAGKSTLGRILGGRLAPRAGQVTLGRKVEPLYYDQAQADIPNQGTAFGLVRNAHVTATNQQLRAHLGRFGFPAADGDKDVASLSGGERARLALAILTLTPANLLILDEPTNHLDLDTREALESALTEFDGTVLLISHDRYLLDAVTTRTLVVADGRVHDEPGPFGEVRERLRASAGPSGNGVAAPAAETSAQAHKRMEKERRALERDLRRTEERIAAAEARTAELDAIMARADVPWQQLQDAQQERAGLAAELEQLMASWETLSHALEESGGAA